MNIKIIDNAVPLELRTQVWDYLLNQTWHIKYKQDSTIDSYVPSKDGIDIPNKNPVANGGTYLARTPLAKDVHYLKAQHKILYNVWQKINAALDNQYELTGSPERMPLPSNFSHPKSVLPESTIGWRVYTNCQYQENIKHSHGIHRDNPDLKDSSAVTILYVANLEWYPSWFAECVYYSDSETGDTQNFQSSDCAAQNRNFNLGWAQQIVSPVPGRIICYDSRTLHTTRPAAWWAPGPRVTVAFRARLK